MSWIEASPGIFQRPLNSSELGMCSFVAKDIPREPIKVVVVADFRAPHPADKVTEAFKIAWKALRLLKSPDIATTFGDNVKRYEVQSTQGVDEWVNKTFAIGPVGITVHTAVKDRQLYPEFLPVCHILPQHTQDRTFKGSIAFFISHWRTEAGGALQVLNQLFEYAVDILEGGAITREALSKYTSGDEIQLLTPSIEEILMPNREPTPEAKARIESHFANYYAHLPSIDFPMKGKLGDPPSYCKLRHRIYTPASTKNFVAACKASGLSVTAAVHAAYLGAVYELAEPDMRKRSYASLMPAQVRTRLPVGSPLRDQGCWSAAQMLMLALPAEQDFLTRSRSLRKQYELASDEKWLYEDTREVSAQMMAPPADLPPAPDSMPWFTSLGVLDGAVILPQHGDMEIDDVMAWADGIGPGIVMRLWTFRRRLTLQIAWNLAFHDDELIKETMDSIDRILGKELGVNLEIEQDKEDLM